MGLSAAILGGCAATPETMKPTVQPAVASKSNTTYIIKKASIRTASPVSYKQNAQSEVNRQARRQIQAYQSTDNTSRKSSVAVGLTREQYHIRFEAEQRAREAEQVRAQQAKAAAEQQQRIARNNAIRAEYLQKWEANKAAIKERQIKAKSKRVRQQAEARVKQERTQVMVKKVENVIRT
ncbi:MAG TPA: hypothetical protein PLM98_15335, partial [Thiolinea sp.]|nr:hypothetical protein [Thiolinea sp.]